MNEIVTRMIDMLFADVEMTPEVSILHDEVMANCQDRFMDCKDRGMSDTDALAEVAASLKGMEEMLADYPRSSRDKTQNDNGDMDNKTESDGEQTHEEKRKTFELNSVHAGMVNDDVTIVPSGDANVHVVINGYEVMNAEVWETIPQIRMDPDEGTHYVLSLEAGKLDLEQKLMSEQKPLHMDTLDWSSFSALAGELAGRMKQAVNTFGRTKGSVRILLPNVHPAVITLTAMGGSFTVDGIAADDMRCETTAGMIDVSARNGETCSHVLLKTMSGRIHADIDANDLTMSTLSGSISWTGKATTIDAGTLSGVIKAEGSFEHGKLHTVSGDIRLMMDTTGATASCSSTSGSITVILPAVVHALHCDTDTASGEVLIERKDIPDGGESSDIYLKLHTLSGRIAVR